jgi:hypothetical protein
MEVFPVTDPSEVKISDAEIGQFYKDRDEHLAALDTICDEGRYENAELEADRHALALLIARRTPAVIAPIINAKDLGHNACRARVLAGPEG